MFEKRVRLQSGLVFAGIAVLLLASVAGCSSLEGSAISSTNESEVSDNTPSQPSVEYLDDEIASQEYEEAISLIDEPLPTGVSYPPGLPSNFLPSDGGRLQTGAARNQAWFTWLCAWEAEYLDNFSSDVDAQKNAEDMIARWAEMDFYSSVVVDPEQGWVSNVLDPMLLGDPSGVRADHLQLCSHYPTVSAQ